MALVPEEYMYALVARKAIASEPTFTDQVLFLSPPVCKFDVSGYTSFSILVLTLPMYILYSLLRTSKTLLTLSRLRSKNSDHITKASPGRREN